MLGAPLPNAAQAWVPPAKMTGYLLNTSQEHGEDFIALGYHMGNLEVLERDLIFVAQTYPVDDIRLLPGGIGYGMQGNVPVPSGLIRTIRTAWFIPSTGSPPADYRLPLPTGNGIGGRDAR